MIRFPIEVNAKLELRLKLQSADYREAIRLLSLRRPKPNRQIEVLKLAAKYVIAGASFPEAVSPRAFILNRDFVPPRTRLGDRAD